MSSKTPVNHQRTGSHASAGIAPPKTVLPFDLNNLINLSHSFEVLKETLEYLAANQQQQGYDILRLNE